MAHVIYLLKICDLHEIQYLHKMHEQSDRHDLCALCEMEGLHNMHDQSEIFDSHKI